MFFGHTIYATCAFGANGRGRSGLCAIEEHSREATHSIHLQLYR
jgi:hypothetical protein